MNKHTKWLLTWDDYWGDEGGGHVMVAVYDERIDAERDSRTLDPPEGHRRSEGGYNVEEIPHRRLALGDSA